MRTSLNVPLFEARAIGAGGAGGHWPPGYGRSVNPISNRGAYHAQHITTCPSGFSDLPTALWVAFDTSKAHTDLIDVLIRLGLFDKLQS